MKLLLAALNSKYIHTNLAIRYLKKIAEGIIEDVQINEFTINHHNDYIIAEIYKKKPDILCFSCYIWNIEMIIHICSVLKKVLPEVTIVLGGPEVSFQPEELMHNEDSIDVIVTGAGEASFKELLTTIKNKGNFSEIKGIAYRSKEGVYKTQHTFQPLLLKDIPFPYEGEELEKDKILYYESSRGCPYNCQYCLSSTFKGIDFLPIERVKEELGYLLRHKIKQIKFVDRTFNANKAYAIEIIKYILENENGVTNFHFEISADLLDEEVLSILKNAPVGLIQFEIGVQTTNKKTLKAIDRKMNFDRLKNNVMDIASYKNIHQHLDLIVGLPYEDYKSFRQSFDDVFVMRPEKLQVGFLKLLKGSGLRDKQDEYGYLFNHKPPYEVIRSNDISFGEILKLKGIEEMVEIFWNSRLFITSIEVIIQNYYNSPFNFFEDLWNYWEIRGYQHQSHGKNQLYKILRDFYNMKGLAEVEAFYEILKFDFLKNIRTASLPLFMTRILTNDFKNKCHEFLQNDNNLKKYLPSYINEPAKSIIKKVHFEVFRFDVLAIEQKPTLIKGTHEEEKVVLFNYDLENKALAHSKYYNVIL